MLPQERQRRFAVLGGVHVVAVAAELCREHAAQVGLVVDHQDLIPVTPEGATAGHRKHWSDYSLLVIRPSSH